MESGEETSDFERIESLNAEEMEQLIKDYDGDRVMNGAVTNGNVNQQEPHHPSEPTELSFEKRKSRTVNWVRNDAIRNDVIFSMLIHGSKYNTASGCAAAVLSY